MALITKEKLIEEIRMRFGYPVVKVELSDQQISKHIDRSVQKFKKWAVGQATQEVWFTMMLSGGQYLYDLPVGVTEVISYDFHNLGSGINTLFTIDNYMYNKGMYDGLFANANIEGSRYSLVSYHIARDFLDMVKKYNVDEYNYKYHWSTNQLEIQPPPKCDSTLTTIQEDITCNPDATYNTYTSPGFILLRTMMLEGSTLPDYPYDSNESYFFDLDWVTDYSTAQCKVTLGMIRRKFSQFQSIGNQGISLDGDSLVSEGKEEMERLEERLRDEESYWGYGIEIG